ncbi:MAG TPA: AAA family ATPase [Polyangiaceae bacterium]|nr:AAA family ATPase [Polyangiaceae bacterium]
MQRPPPGHSLTGASLPALGGALHRVRRDSDGCELVARSADSGYPGDAAVQHLDAEFGASLRNSGIRHVPRPSQRIDGERVSWLLYEDVAGYPLDATSPCELAEFWDIAEAAAAALSEAHQSGRAHGRLQSNCIWWDPSTRRVALLGMVPAEDAHLANQLPPTEDTAPELIVAQRAKVSIAADIYSLGAIFYRLLTGRAAVASSGHLAFEAAANPPARLDPARFPEALCDLVTRMLSKAPGWRPADASAVFAELQAARLGAQSPARVPDRQARHFVGRAADLELLLAQARLAESGASTVVRLAGEPGIGKSTLLGELIRVMAARHRIVADGKCEQFRQGRPYSALFFACANALSHVLAGEEPALQSVRRRLREADPALLAVLRPEMPELEHLCGPLPAVPQAGPSENEHRFKRAFTELLATLCSQETRLVLILDDVQWADRATADLLAEIFEAGLPDHFMLVLAYRDNAAQKNPDLGKLFRVLAAAPLIQLGPFDLTDTETLCEQLVPDCDGAQTLAAALQDRSHGNPLHAAELVRSLMDNGELVRERGRWVYRNSGHALQDLSETVVALIRDRLRRAPPETQRLLTAAACAGHRFSVGTLAVALGEDPSRLGSRLDAAVRGGFLVASQRGSELAFCHDRVQQLSFELGDANKQAEIFLRLGRYYRGRIAQDQSALFPCLECLNQARNWLDPDELQALALLNLEGARRARASIAYERAILLLGSYLASDQLSAEDRFEASLLLAECTFLLEARDATSADVPRPSPSDVAMDACAALATTEQQRIELLHRRLLFCAHRQEYAAGVKIGLDALASWNQSLPRNPGLLRALGTVLWLRRRLRRITPGELAGGPGSATERDRDVYRFLVGLWGCAWWESPLLGLLVAVRLVEFALRCGSGPHSAMGCISYSIILHMLGERAQAISYARTAEELALGQSPYIRAFVRFARLTFMGVLERPLNQVVEKYDEALRECVAHGESIAAHLIDGALTTLPHLGPELPLVTDALVGYEREARALGATACLELIGLVRSWRDLLVDGHLDAETGEPRKTALFQEVKHRSYIGTRDLLRMQVAYLTGSDDEVLRLGDAVEKHGVFKGNPLHRASHALFVVLASTRKNGRLTRAARAGIRFLEGLDAFSPAGEASFGTFRASLRLAQGVRAAAARDASALGLLKEAAAVAREKGQRLVLAVCLERLGRLYGLSGQYGSCVESLRDAAHAFRRFGATAAADALVREFPAIDWMRPEAANAETLQAEGIMRAATAIVEATSTDELGPTLLRVIATTAGAMRAVLFQIADGKPMLVAECERDQANLLVKPTPLAELDPLHYALKPVHRVERSHELAELPRQRAKFLDDPYLAGRSAPRALLCVPLVYRGELVAILYLENSSNAETFSQEEIRLVTLLGKQAAIAMTNADNHRLEIEALQSKVNPHFLHNALSVVAELAGRAPDQAEEAAYKLNRLYRAMVTSRADLRVPLEKELALVRDYLELERARFGNKLQVSWDIEDAVKSCGVPSLLIQPLAENAVNHGVRRKEGGSGTVSISARLRDDTVILRVSDDGPGWYEGKGGTGFGLRSVRRRLQLVYGNRAELTVVKAKGVAVEIAIPAQAASATARTG